MWSARSRWEHLHSDCDFLVVVADRLTAAQEEALREFHDEIPTRPGYWEHNLEGSYAPSADLETIAALDERWLYVDRGWREMQWSTHCNTEDVRWTLRERGITLAGPNPRDLVAEVIANEREGPVRQARGESPRCGRIGGNWLALLVDALEHHLVLADVQPLAEPASDGLHTDLG